MHLVLKNVFNDYYPPCCQFIAIKFKLHSVQMLIVLINRKNKITMSRRLIYYTVLPVTYVKILFNDFDINTFFC